MSTICRALVLYALASRVWSVTISIPATGLVIPAGSQLTLNAGDKVALSGMIIISAGAKIVAKGTPGTARAELETKVPT